MTRINSQNISLTSGLGLFSLLILRLFNWYDKVRALLGCVEDAICSARTYTLCLSAARCSAFLVSSSWAAKINRVPLNFKFEN
jgi:hypothetical protein